MASKGQLTGMTGAFLVAAQLSNRGLIASATSRSAAGADILVTDSECCVAYSIQVKTNSKKNAKWWILGNKQLPKGGDSHIYVFVNLATDDSGDVTADYYIVPSQALKRIAQKATSENWKPYVVSLAKILKYHNKWSVFEASKKGAQVGRR